jgi:hypothetical protein
MKNILSALLLLTLLVSTGFAQFGVKGGLSIGTFGGDDKSQIMLMTGLATDPKTQSGFTGGVYYHIGLLMGLSIQPEVLYTQRGGVYESAIPNSISEKTTTKFAYLDIPVVVQYALPIPVVKPFVEGGVSYGIPLKATLTEEFTPFGATTHSAETDIKDKLTKGDLSIVIGAGVRLDLFVASVNVGARYVIGQTKVYKDGDAKVYNRTILVTAGVNF